MKEEVSGDNGLVVYTIGHSTRPLEEFITLLRAHGVRRVADIRTVPRSRRNPQYSRDELSRSLRNRRLSYVYVGKLGGLRRTSKTSPNTGWRNSSFRGYADYMRTAEFKEGLERLIRLAREKPTAMMCAEAVPWRCHRSLVADALIARGIEVRDIMSATSAREHKLNPMAVVDGDTITYPPTDP